MATPPNMLAQKLVTMHFEADVVVDVLDPKHPSADDIENRLGDGPQWMDGVRKVTVTFMDQYDEEGNCEV